MKQMITQSLFWRALCRLRDWYQFGMLAAFFQTLAESYPHSQTKKLWEHFIWQPMITEQTSVYARLLEKTRLRLQTCGQWLQQSAVYRYGLQLGRRITAFAGSGYIGRFCRFMGARGFLLAAFSLYLPLDYFLRNIVNIGVVSSLWDEGMMALCLLYLMYRRAMERAPLGTRATSLDGFLLLFIAVSILLMCFNSPYLSIAVDGLRVVVQYLLWFFVLIRLLEDDRDFGIFYGTLLLMAFGIALHGMYQYIIAAPIPASWMTQTEAGVRTRVYSLTGSPNIMGSLLVLFAPMAMALAYWSKKTWVKVSAVCATGVFCLSILFTFSKGAWGGLVIAIVVFALFLDRRLLALMAAAGAGALLFIPSVSNRITYLFTSDYAEASARAGRSVRWEIGLQTLHEYNPFVGVGLGRFGGAVAMQNRIMEQTDNFQYFYMDNYYLKTLVEMGYIGLFFFLLLLVGAVVWCLRGVGRTRNRSVHPLSVGMFAGMCGVLFHCYFENIFEVQYMVAYFWALAAGILYLGYFKRKRRATEET